MTSDDQVVFVSYTRRDAAFAQPFAAYMRARGFATWVDVENLGEGEAWEEAVRAVLPGVSRYVACLSANSVKSRWTSVEHKCALGLALAITPVLIDEHAQLEATTTFPDLPPVDVSPHPLEEAAFRAAAIVARQTGGAVIDRLQLIARAIHERWRAAQLSAPAPVRWKALAERDGPWVTEHAARLGARLRTSSDQHAVDLQSLSCRQLPPSIAEDSLAAAQHVASLLSEGAPATLESLAAQVHQAWLARNGAVAAPELTVPYGSLAEHEKEKDRIVVRTAALAFGLPLPD